MKLYYYEHCPFSAKARMALNLKQVEAERVVLLADDERTIAELIGKHQIPVLITDEGDPLAESDEIVRYVDEHSGLPRFSYESSQAVSDWIDGFVPTLQFLGYPRWTRIGLAEFDTPEAYEHFREKKTDSIGDFDQAVARTDEKVAEVNEALRQLPTLAELDAGRPQITLDDFRLFPMLRSLSVVKSVDWPAPVRRYVEGMAERSGLDTYFDRAL